MKTFLKVYVDDGPERITATGDAIVYLDVDAIKYIRPEGGGTGLTSLRIETNNARVFYSTMSIGDLLTALSGVIDVIDVTQ